MNITLEHFKTSMMRAAVFVILGLIAMQVAASERQCDIVFCIDTSDSMTNVRTLAAQKAIKNWADYWKVNPFNGVNMGVILFANRAQKLFSMSDQFSLSQVKSSLNSYSGPQGSTALDACLRMSFAPGAGYFLDSTRSASTRQYMVIMTDGDSNNPAETRRWISQLRAGGVTVVALALGRAENYDDLYELRNAESDFFYHQLDLNNLMNNIAIRDAICPALCGGLQFDSNTQQCCNGVISQKNSPCQEYCSGQAFNPTTQKCCNSVTIRSINAPCNTAGGNTASDNCVSRNWYPTQGQCDGQSRCVDDGNGNNLIETTGCGCNEFRDNNGICGLASGINCADDPCRDRSVIAWRFHNHNTESCRAYWQCKTGRSAGSSIKTTRCCRPWEVFNTAENRCVLDVYQTCKEICPCSSANTVLPACRKFVDRHDPQIYWEARRDSRSGLWTLHPSQCLDGNIFSNNLCRCSAPNAPGILGIPNPAANTGLLAANDAGENNGNDNGAANGTGGTSSDSDSSDGTAATGATGATSSNSGTSGTGGVGDSSSD